MNNWLSIGPVDQIPRQGARVVELEGVEIAVFRTVDDKIFALVDRCPHKGGPLSQGIVFGDRVACPLHNWHIDLASGEALAPDEGCAGHFATKVTDGEVYIATTQSA